MQRAHGLGFRVSSATFVVQGVQCKALTTCKDRVSGFQCPVSDEQSAVSLSGVWGLGFGVWGLGFGVWGLGFGVWGLWFGPGACQEGFFHLDWPILHDYHEKIAPDGVPPLNDAAYVPFGGRGSNLGSRLRAQGLGPRAQGLGPRA
jgi:hypothetical protein